MVDTLPCSTSGRFIADGSDEASLLACAAYVDLNPIRASMAQTLEHSDHTSVQRRIEAFADDKQSAEQVKASTDLATR